MDLHTTATNLRRIEQQVAEQFARIEPPPVPVERSLEELAELDPKSPHTARGQVACAVVAATAFVAGVIPLCV